MAKTYKKNISSLVKTTNKKVLPAVNDSLKTVSVVAKTVAEETIPIVEKGVSNVYGTMNTGFNLGVSSAKKVGKSIKNISNKKVKRGGSYKRKVRTHKRKVRFSKRKY